jgi:FkbM family methyltransferase
MSLPYRLARWVGRAVGAESRVGRAVRPLAERLLYWSSGGRGIEWEINGIRCRVDPRFRAQMARDYDAGLARFLRGRVLPGQTCLDVGANVGAWVIQFAHAVGPAGRVVAFEPNPAARAVLESHVRLNNLAAVVQVVPAAVAAEAGEATFFAAGSDGMSRIGEPNPLLAGRAAALTVPVVTLDGWCRENAVSPDWLFIDVEGFEGHALAGSADLIRSRGSDLGIVIEMHPGAWSASGTTREQMAALIGAIGRRPVPLTGQVDTLGEYGHVLLASG